MGHRPRPTSSSQRVEFVDENDAWSFRLGLLKEISHPGRPYPHEHFHKLRSADGEEWSAGFARDGLSQQGFARSRRTDKQDAFGNPSAHTGKLLRRSEEFNDLLQFVLRF